MKKKDNIVIVIALLMAGVLYAVSQLSLGADASVVVVSVDGEERLRRPLVMESSYEIRQVNRHEPLFILKLIGNAFSSLRIFFKEKPDVYHGTWIEAEGVRWRCADDCMENKEIYVMNI